MEILTTAAITLTSGVIASLITLAVTHRNDVKKFVLEQRAELYCRLFNVVDRLINQPQLAFNKQYMEELIGYKAGMKLLASKKTFPLFAELFETVIEPYNSYDVYCGYHEGEDINNFDGETYAGIKNDLDLSPEEFISKYIPDREVVDSCIRALYESMRDDLGSNLKR